VDKWYGGSVNSKVYDSIKRNYRLAYDFDRRTIVVQCDGVAVAATGRFGDTESDAAPLRGANNAFVCSDGQCRGVNRLRTVGCTENCGGSWNDVAVAKGPKARKKGIQGGRRGYEITDMDLDYA
jgi:hypothetical protein